MTNQPDWESVRREFPALVGRTFLNTATYGQMPRRSVDAAARHFARREEGACMDFLDWFDDMDQLRASVATLIHAQPDDIAFVQNASSGLAILLSGIDWREGDKVVTAIDEFPNNLYATGALRRKGVEYIAAENERLTDAIDSRTRLVALSTVNYTSGYRPPLEAIAKRARENGALLFLDGTQSIGALQFDVRAIQPDMLAVHGYKWLLSPNGAGFAYIAPSVRKWLPPNVIGWRSHRDWRNVDDLHHGSPAFSDGAEKYEGGMLPFALLYAMQASIGMILELGQEVIERRVLNLSGEVRNIVRRAGADVTPDETPIVAAKFDGVDVSQLATRLEQRNVMVSARHGHLRISPHFYNNEEDLGKLEESLRAVL